MSHLLSSADVRDTGQGHRPRHHRGARPGRKRISTAAWFRSAAVLAGAALVSTAVAAVPAAAARRTAAPADHQLSAVIARTAGGVPHIHARNWTSLGLGYGYAFAQDNLGTMASDYITVEAKRSRYFGPRATYNQRGNGVAVTNLGSDLFFSQIIDSRIVQRG